MNEKKYFFVDFKWDDVVFCANIVHAESIEAVKKEYSKYGWYNIKDIQIGELEIAKKKGMPIIEL